jgi:ribosomal protein L19
MSFFANGKFKRDLDQSLKNAEESSKSSIQEKLKDGLKKFKTGEFVLVDGKVVSTKQEGEFTMSQIVEMFNNITTERVESNSAYNTYHIKSGDVLLVDLMITENPHRLIPDWKINVSTVRELAEWFRNEKLPELAKLCK